MALAIVFLLVIMKEEARERSGGKNQMSTERAKY